MTGFGANPMGNFDIARPVGQPKFKPKQHKPKNVPQADDLFQVQRNSLKVLNEVQRLRDKHPQLDRDLAALERDAENTYRVIRTYLDHNVNPQGI